MQLFIFREGICPLNLSLKFLRSRQSNLIERGDRLDLTPYELPYVILHMLG